MLEKKFKARKSVLGMIFQSPQKNIEGENAQSQQSWQKRLQILAPINEQQDLLSKLQQIASDIKHDNHKPKKIKSKKLQRRSPIQSYLKTQASISNTQTSFFLTEQDQGTYEYEQSSGNKFKKIDQEYENSSGNKFKKIDLEYENGKICKDDDQVSNLSQISDYPYTQKNYVSQDDKINEKFELIKKKEPILQKITRQFKNADKIQRQHDYFKTKMSLSQTLLSTLSKNNLMPKKLNMIDSKVEKYGIKLNNFYIGKRYASIIDEALKHKDLTEISSINIKNSQALNPENAKQLLNSFPVNVMDVDISYNKVGLQGAVSLQLILNCENYTNLKKLNISGCQLSDQAAILIFQALVPNSSLKVLDMSHNYVTSIGCLALKNLLKENQDLQEIYLNWNKIKGKPSGIAISEGLKNNSQLRVLDISFNSIKGVVDILRNISNELRHIDFSYNCIDYKEMVEIAQVLEKNHSLYGIHLEGNCNAIVNGLGYIHLQKDQEFQVQSQRNILKRRIKGLQYLNEQCKYQSIDLISADNCWICDGWKEMKLEFNLDYSKQIQDEPIYVHLSTNDYLPLLLQHDPDYDDIYFLYVMVPPNQDIYFFYTNPTNKKITINQEIAWDYTTNIYQEHNELQKPYDGNNQIKVKYISTDPKQKHEIVQYRFPKYLNLIEIEQLEEENLKPIINQEENEPNVTPIPRPLSEFIPQKIKKRNSWTVAQNSLFKEFKRDRPNLYDECFEFDWNMSKIPKIVKNDDDMVKLKEILKVLYPRIKNTYKYYSALSILGDTLCIQQNTFSDFVLLGSKGIVDGRLLKITDIDILFITTNQNIQKERNPRNPDRALIRYQFMEILVRIAGDKYLKNGLANSMTEAFQKLLNDGLLKKLEEAVNPQDWRDRRYWNKQCDIVMRQKSDFLKALFDKFALSRQRKEFTNMKTLNLTEFKDMMIRYDLFDEKIFLERDLNLAFCLSIMTQVDELSSDRHQQMNFLEFQECIARIAENLSLPPLFNEKQSIKNQRKDFDNQTLSEKIQNFVFLMMRKVLEKEGFVIVDKKKPQLTKEDGNAYKQLQLLTIQSIAQSKYYENHINQLKKEQMEYQEKIINQSSEQSESDSTDEENMEYYRKFNIQQQVNKHKPKKRVNQSQDFQQRENLVQTPKYYHIRGKTNGFNQKNMTQRICNQSGQNIKSLYQKFKISSRKFFKNSENSISIQQSKSMQSGQFQQN